MAPIDLSMPSLILYPPVWALGIVIIYSGGVLAFLYEKFCPWWEDETNSVAKDGVWVKEDVGQKEGVGEKGGVGKKGGVEKKGGVGKKEEMWEKEEVGQNGSVGQNV